VNAITFYDKNATQYDLPANKHFYSRIAAELLKLIPAGFTPESILEIGAGTGFSTARLSDKYPHAKITGLEPSAAMLAKAKEKFPDITWQNKSLEDFAACKHFDLVFCSMAAHWLTSKEWQALMNIPAKSLALALPAISDNTQDNQANMLLKKLVFILKSKPNWLKETRHLDYLFKSRPLKIDKLNFIEKFENCNQLAESLYTRGVLVALFGNKAEEAKELLQKDLRSLDFNWNLKLITAAGHGRDDGDLRALSDFSFQTL